MRICNWRTDPTCPSPDEIANALKQEFDITNKWSDADLVLPDGTMIDIGRYRAHGRAAHVVWEFLDIRNTGWGVGEMLFYGNIVRLSRSPRMFNVACYCVPSLDTKPGRKQMGVVVDVYYLSDVRKSLFTLDVFVTNTSGSMTYDERSTMDPELPDIMEFINKVCHERASAPCTCVEGHEPCCQIFSTHIMSAILKMQAREGEGALLNIRVLRREFPSLSKWEFDAYILELLEREKIWVHRHVHKAQMTDQERKDYVRTPEGEYYVGIVVR